MNRRIVLSGIPPLLAGCVWPSVETAPPAVRVVIDLGSREWESDIFAIDVDVRTQTLRTNEDVTFDSVSIVFYNMDKEKISAKDIGRISSMPPNNDVSVTVKSPSVPSFIVVESPNFWTHNQMEMVVYAWKQDESTERFSQYSYSTPEHKFPS